MRTDACKQGRHGGCGGVVNRGLVDNPRLDDCSCQCHARPKPRVDSTPTAATRRAVHDRDGWRCKAQVEGVCTGRPDHAHHLVRASQLGPDTLDNLLTVCFECHTWIHANIYAALDLGLLRRSTD